MSDYIPQKIEKKWQKVWEKNKVFKTKIDKNKKKGIQKAYNTEVVCA